MILPLNTETRTLPARMLGRSVEIGNRGTELPILNHYFEFLQGRSPDRHMAVKLRARHGQRTAKRLKEYASHAIWLWLQAHEVDSILVILK